MSIKNRVILCAGHGGGDPGATGQGTYEALEAQKITDLTVRHLQNAGVEVHLVPHELNLIPSISWVNRHFKSATDAVAVEIHKNSGGGTGTEVWTPSYPDQTILNVSSIVADELSKSTGLPNRGVKQAQNNRHGGLGWCDQTNTYAILVEAGFIDRDPVTPEMNNRMAVGIANGVMRALGISRKVMGDMLEYKKLAEGKIWIEMKLDKVHEWDLISGPNYKAKATYTKGQVIAVTHYIDTNSTRYYVTDPSVMKGYKFGFNIKDVITHKSDPVEAERQRRLIENRKAVIAQAYKDILERDPQAGEVDYYLRYMANGRTPEDVRDDLLRGGEYHRLRTSRLEGEVKGIRALLDKIVSFLSEKFGFRR